VDGGRDGERDGFSVRSCVGGDRGEFSDGDERTGLWTALDIGPNVEILRRSVSALSARHAASASHRQIDR